MHALVTGATGFLGRYIAQQLLASGARVRVLCRREDAALASAGAALVQGDLREASQVHAACAGVDVVFHVGGVAGIWGPWRHFYEVNVLGTQAVIQGCLAHGVRRLVYTSSPSVTFTGADQCGIDESAPYAARWLCHYPRSKALAEQAVLAANGRNGLLTCALRPHLIWGPGDRHLVPRLIERARRGQLRRVGEGHNLIDMVYVENAAEAHLRAAEALVAGSPVCGQAYFISQGEPVRCWEWIDTILACAGLESVRRGISARAAWWAGWACEAAWTLLRLPGEPRMTRFLALQLARSHYFSIERARRDFGYQPRVSTADGLRRLAAWLQAPAPHAPSPAHLPQPEGRT
jgi:nucleoside-diphosphate-sugar epimerase